MIGNGFDLNIGLQTRFSDFLPYYVKKAESSDDAINTFKNAIEKEGYETWADFEKQLGMYTKDFNSSTKHDVILCRDNFVDELIKYLRVQVNKVNFDGRDTDIRRVFVDSLTGFFRKNRLPEISFANILQTFRLLRASHYTYNFITFNYTNILESCLNIIKKQTLPPIWHNNFTPINVSSLIGEILHIHGTLDDSVIVGINGATQIANDELSQDTDFVSRLAKPLMNKRIRNTKHEQGVKILKSSDIICVFGMSMGETDAMWWQWIGYWLSQKENSHLIIWDYAPHYQRGNPGPTMKYTDHVISRFYRVAQMSMDTSAKVENRIHVGFNNGSDNDLFKINLIKVSD